MQAVAFGNAAAARSVHADGMHFIEIGHRAVFIGEIADFLDGRDVAIHRIDRLEGDQLRRTRVDARRASGFEILQVVVLPDHASRISSAGCPRSSRRGCRHRKAQRCRGSSNGQRRERCPVRHVAGGEEQRGFLAMQVGEFALEQDMIVVGAGDVAGAAGTGAAAVDASFIASVTAGAGPCRDSRSSTRR
jgi:hypothetical protein